jgi:hypothetical protein
MQRLAFLRPGGNRALDLVNFFVADAQTGFGPFVAVYLTTHKWTQIEIGSALPLGTVTSLISQLPAGMLVGSLRNKRIGASDALGRHHHRGPAAGDPVEAVAGVDRTDAAWLRQLRADTGDRANQPSHGGTCRLERQRVGIAKTKAERAYKARARQGRSPTWPEAAPPVSLLHTSRVLGLRAFIAYLPRKLINRLTPNTYSSQMRSEIISIARPRKDG